MNVEQLQGRGKVEGKGIDIAVSYTIQTTENENGWKTITGTIQFDSPQDEYRCFGLTLILHLDDGRRTRVLIVGGGRIQGAGGGFLSN